MAVFRIFKVADVRHLGFLKVGNLNFRYGLESQFVSSSQTWCRSVKQLQRYGHFFHFLRWRPSAILDLLYACLDHPQSVVGSLYRCAKFGWNRHCSFEDMQFSMLCEFGLKMPIHVSFGVFLGVKMKENGNFLNQTASKSLLWFSLWTRAIIGVTKKEN